MNKGLGMFVQGAAKYVKRGVTVTCMSSLIIDLLYCIPKTEDENNRTY